MQVIMYNKPCIFKHFFLFWFWIITFIVISTFAFWLWICCKCKRRTVYTHTVKVRSICDFWYILFHVVSHVSDPGIYDKLFWHRSKIIPSIFDESLKWEKIVYWRSCWSVMVIRTLSTSLSSLNSLWMSARIQIKRSSSYTRYCLYLLIWKHLNMTWIRYLCKGYKQEP